MIDFFANTYGSLGIAQNVRWTCEPIILSIGRFEGPSKVQLNSWCKTVNV